MIKRLRKQFIRIAMLSVTILMLILSLIVHVAHYISTASALTEMPAMICENKGTIPRQNDLGADDENRPGAMDMAPDRKPEKQGRPFNQETPYSTRYFSLHFDENGSVILADLAHIAAITDDDIQEYVSVALRHGTGYGYYGNYKFCVVQHEEDRYMAVFLDCYLELRAVKIVAVCSVAAIIVCIVLVYVLVVFLSRKAIDPVVRSEMLDVFMEYIQDENHSILMSSHITSDLERVADSLTFIHSGKIIMSDYKDVILENARRLSGARRS